MLECGEQVRGDGQGAGNRNRPVGETFSQVLAREVGLDEVEVLVVAGIVDQRAERGPTEPGKHGSFVFKPDAYGWSDGVDVEEFHHYQGVVSLRVRGQVGLDAVAPLEEP